MFHDNESYVSRAPVSESGGGCLWSSKGFYSSTSTAVLYDLFFVCIDFYSVPVGGRGLLAVTGQAMEEEETPWELLYNLGIALVQRGAAGDDAAAESCLGQAEEACREVPPYVACVCDSYIYTSICKVRSTNYFVYFCHQRCVISCLYTKHVYSKEVSCNV